MTTRKITKEGKDFVDGVLLLQNQYSDIVARLLLRIDKSALTIYALICGVQSVHQSLGALIRSYEQLSLEVRMNDEAGTLNIREAERQWASTLMHVNLMLKELTVIVKELRPEQLWRDVMDTCGLCNHVTVFLTEWDSRIAALTELQKQVIKPDDEVRNVCKHYHSLSLN